MDQYFYQTFGIHYDEVDTNPTHCIPDDSGLDRRYFYFPYNLPKD